MFHVGSQNGSVRNSSARSVHADANLIGQCIVRSDMEAVDAIAAGNDDGVRSGPAVDLVSAVAWVPEEHVGIIAAEELVVGPAAADRVLALFAVSRDDGRCDRDAKLSSVDQVIAEAAVSRDRDRAGSAQQKLIVSAQASQLDQLDVADGIGAGLNDRRTSDLRSLRADHDCRVAPRHHCGRLGHAERIVDFRARDENDVRPLAAVDCVGAGRHDEHVVAGAAQQRGIGREQVVALAAFERYPDNGFRPSGGLHRVVALKATDCHAVERCRCWIGRVSDSDKRRKAGDEYRAGA